MMNDNEMLAVLDEYKTAGPERKQEIKGLAQQWQQADQTAAEQETWQHYQGIYTDRNRFENLAANDSVLTAQAHSDKPEEVKYEALNRSFLSAMAGRDLGDYDYPYQRDGYAQVNFGRAPGSESEFYELVRGQFQTVQQREAALGELQGQVALHALRDTLEGRDPLVSPTFQEWAGKHPDLIDEEHEAAYLEQAQKFQQTMLGEMLPLSGHAARVWKSLTAFTEGRATGDDVEGVGRELAQLPRPDRDKIYEYAALAASASGVDRAAFEQFAKNLGESISRSFDFVGNWDLDAKEATIEQMIDFLRDRGSEAKWNNLGDYARMQMASTERGGKALTGELSDEEKETYARELSGELEVFQVVRELKELAKKRIDPIKLVAREGTALGYAEQGLYGLAGSTGYLALSSIPYVGLMAGFAAYQTDEYNRIRVENPEMSRSAARGLSFAEAAGNVLLDRMQLRRLPVLAGLAREVKAIGWGRAARKAGLVWGEQTAQELAQNAIAPVFETIASAMRTDMTPRDAGQEFSRYIEDIPATLAATGWLALIGGGLASVRDIKNPQADVDVALRHWGFSEEQSRRIKAAATPEAFDAAVREGMPLRTPGDIAAGRREAEAAWRQAEQEQADPAQPRLEAITRGERGTEWIVRDSAGRETLRTPNSETAQLAIAELQQSAARQKQASTLRFSKSGDQAENVGRMWVELARDKRTMQHGETSDAKDLGTLLTEISPEAGQDVRISEQKALNGQNDGYVFQGSDGGEIKVGRYVQDEYFFDTQRAGEHSTPINQAAYAWALNNGNKMVEDPGGLLRIGVLRRTSQMLSAALRAGTTRHMEPGPDSEIVGWHEEKSEADFFHNVGLLAMKEAELVDERLKGLDALRYDGESQAFYDGEHRIPDEEIEAYLGQRIAGVDPDFSERIGNATLRRALATLAAEGAGPSRSWRLVVDNAKASPNLHRIRYARDDRGEQEVSGSQETSAGGKLAEVSGGTRRPRENSGVTREQARQWVGDVLRKWGSELDVTVHESAEAIPDAAMRDEVLREGDVEAFFNGSDGKIHLLADRVNSLSDAERLLKHEGFHWAVGGKLRVEYGQLVAAIGRKIPTDGMQEIITRYPKGTPDLWVEEYLAHLAETNPQSPVWRQFVYEVKRLLRRVFGDRVEYTEQDIRAFLSKAQQRAARAKAADAAEFAKVQEELRFAKNKPKGPQRSSWEEVRKGDRWNSVKKWLPKENVEPTFFPAHGTQEEVVERAYQFITSNPIVTDWTGRLVYLPYPQSKGRYTNDHVRNKAEHVVAYDVKQGTHQRVLDLEKTKWLSLVPSTIANGRVRVRHQGEILYFRNYKGRTHMVVTSSEGVFLKQAAYDSGLVTQYPVYLKDEDFKEAFVEQINPAPLE